MRAQALVCALLASIAMSPGAVAQDQPTGPKLSAFQVYWENDAFLQNDPSDEFYTNGVKIAWMFNPNVKGPPDWTTDFLDLWCRTGLCTDGEVEYGYGHAVGQNMYTPDTTTDPNPQPDDRPWAGYLYYSWILQSTHKGKKEGQDVQNLFELQTGLVGPGAGARFAQTQIHKLIDSAKPLGWSNQIRNEPTINLSYLWRKRIGSSTLDFVPRFGGGVGNVMTYASVGGTVRLGFHISGFPQVLITPTVKSVDRELKKFELYVFAGGEGRAVAHNIFLDGNSFRNGPEILIDRKGFVYDANFGFAVRYKGWRLDYTVVQRSTELDPPPGRTGGSHRFGSFAVSWGLWK